MKIAVVSDLHNDRAVTEVLMTRLAAFDRVFYLGDGSEAFVSAAGRLNLPVTAVKGNCDAGTDFPELAVEEACGARFLLAHGHRLGVECSLAPLAFTARKYGCAFALYGHTHIRFARNEGSLTLFNPGSPARPRLGRPSFGVLEWDGSKFLTNFEDILSQFD